MWFSVVTDFHFAPRRNQRNQHTATIGLEQFVQSVNRPAHSEVHHAPATTAFVSDIL
jgi:hypothetical protein